MKKEEFIKKIINEMPEWVYEIPEWVQTKEDAIKYAEHLNRAFLEIQHVLRIYEIYQNKYLSDVANEKSFWKIINLSKKYKRFSKEEND